MTNEENYCFDVGGYLVVRAALQPGEVLALNAALDRFGRAEGMLGWPGKERELFRDLLVHPILVRCLNQICGSGFRLEQPPRLIADDPAGGGDFDGTLAGGDEPRHPALAYYHQNNRRQCQLVRAVWALSDVDEDDGGLVFVQASHKTNVPPPPGLLEGGRDLGLVRGVRLRAGDLLLLAGTLMHGLRPWKGRGPLRLLGYGFAARGVCLEAGTGPQAGEPGRPEWHAELTPEQRAVLYQPGRRSETPAPVLAADGGQHRVSESPEPRHPSFLAPDPASGIDHEELFYWDLCGHLVLRQVMDPDDLALANEAIDRFEERIVVGEELARGSTSLAGTGRPTLGGLLQLPPPWCDPFRRMVAHPAIVHRLTWMGCSGFRCSPPAAFCAVKGTSGHALHDANEPLNPSRSYALQERAQLLRGGHRDLAIARPERGRRRLRLRAGQPQGPVPHAPRRALLRRPHGAGGPPHLPGRGRAAVHGRSPDPRRPGLARGDPAPGDPRQVLLPELQPRRGDLAEGMTDAQLAVMRGPDRDNHNGNVPRLVVDGGRVYVDYERKGGLYSTETPKGPVAAG